MASWLYRVHCCAIIFLITVHLSALHAITWSNDIKMAFWLLSLPTFAVAQGTESKQKNFGNQLGVAATDDVFQDRTYGTDVEMSLGSLNYEWGRPSLECQGSECTSGIKSCLRRRMKPGCHRAGKKHVNSSYTILLFLEAWIWAFNLFYDNWISWLAYPGL